MNYPKLSIELGGQPPRRDPAYYNPPFYLNWFKGDEASRAQFSLFLPFIKIRVYPY